MYYNVWRGLTFSDAKFLNLVFHDSRDEDWDTDDYNPDDSDQRSDAYEEEEVVSKSKKKEQKQPKKPKLKKQAGGSNEFRFNNSRHDVGDESRSEESDDDDGSFDGNSPLADVIKFVFTTNEFQETFGEVSTEYDNKKDLQNCKLSDLFMFNSTDLVFQNLLDILQKQVRSYILQLIFYFWCCCNSLIMYR